MTKSDTTAREYRAIAQGKGRWSRFDPTPKFGYACARVTDLGRGNYTSCEMCGTTIRYVHHMVHPTALRLDVGCICAGHMERTSDAVDVEAFIEVAQERDRAMRNRSSRATSRWRKLSDAREEVGNLRLADIPCDTRGYRHVVSELRRLHADAEDWREKAERDDYPEEAHAHAEFMSEVAEFLADQEARLAPLEDEERRAQRRREAVRQSARIWVELDDRLWVRHPRSVQLKIRGHRAWVYQRDQTFKAACQLSGWADPHWDRARYPTEQAAKETALRLLVGALKKEGILLSRKDPDVTAAARHLLYLRDTVDDPVERVLLELSDP